MLPIKRFSHFFELKSVCFTRPLISLGYNLSMVRKITFIIMACLVFVSGNPAHATSQLDDILKTTIATTLTTPAASPWVENDYVRTRLVSNHNEVAYDPTVLHYLGWEIEMKVKGWKTYWRTPGDAGTPPVFNWDNSVNLAKVEVYYPRPERFQIFGIQTFGYGDRVILPIRIEPQIGGAPINIKMHAEFMSCKEICIPFTANYELNLPAPTGTMGAERNLSIYAEDVRNFVLKVPLAASDDKLVLNITDFNLTGVAGQQKLSIYLEGQKHLAGADVFIEAPMNFRFGAPQKQLLGDGGQLLIIFPVHTMGEPDDLRGKDIKLTIHDGWGFSREQNLNIK